MSHVYLSCHWEPLKRPWKWFEVMPPPLKKWKLSPWYLSWEGCFIHGNHQLTLDSCNFKHLSNLQILLCWPHAANRDFGNGSCRNCWFHCPVYGIWLCCGHACFVAIGKGQFDCIFFQQVGSVLCSQKCATCLNFLYSHLYLVQVAGKW